MRKIGFVLFSLLFSGIIVAQPICGFDAANEKLLKTDSIYRQRMRASEFQIQQYIQANPVSAQINGVGTALYMIPVVIHVVNTGGAIGSIYNPTDAKILSVVDYLNQVYDGTAAGFTGGAGDIQIQFVPAKRDPDCNPSNGVDRVDGSVLTDYTDYGVTRQSAKGVQDIDLKNQSRWDPAQYYNIWLVNKIDGNDGTNGQFVAGYSFFAGSAPSVDGIVMLCTQMFVGSKVLPHEMGHALNLFHPFEGSANNTSCPVNNNCSADGDKVCDTDPITYNATAAGVVTFTCRTGTNSCTNTSYKTNTESNVMNYTNCFTLFTPGQKARMIAAMNLPGRQSLVHSPALQPTYSGAVQCPPKINFETATTTLIETSSGLTDCRSFKDYNFNLNIGNSPTIAAAATIVSTGTATIGVDYQLTTNGNFIAPSATVIFPAGVHDNQSFTIRIFDDAALEGDETIILNFSLNNGGGNAVKGEAVPTFTLTIKSNDIIPQSAILQSAKIGEYSTNLGSTSSSQPLDSRIINKKTTFLYKASELTAMGLSAGTVSSFGIYLNKTSSRAYTNMQIKMGATSLEYLFDGSMNGVAVSMVKNLNIYNTVNGLNLFELDVPFVWDGISNIAVQICYDNGTAASGQLADVCQGYSDGGTTSQGNMYWQNGINCTGVYTSVNSYQKGVKPVGYFTIGSSGPQVETLLNAAGTAYLGPFDDVYFYSTDGNILARIKNLGAFDYGCTQIFIDRAGTGSKSYTNTVVAEAVADKTIRVIPANSNPSGQFEITLYYKADEVQGWKMATGKNWSDALLLKTPGAVSSYIAGQVPVADVTTSQPTVAGYGPDSSITAVFTNGFSGFAVGRPTISLPVIYTFNGNGLWTNPANWTNNLVPPASLPAGSQIIINPVADGQCVLNTAQNILPGATLTVNAFKNFIVGGNMTVLQ